MHAAPEKTCLPRAAFPVRPAVNLRSLGTGACGIAYSGIFSRGKIYPASIAPACDAGMAVTATPLLAPGFAPGFCPRGRAGCLRTAAPRAAVAPEMGEEADCAAWLGAFGP